MTHVLDALARQQADLHDAMRQAAAERVRRVRAHEEHREALAEAALAGTPAPIEPEPVSVIDARIAGLKAKQERLKRDLEEAQASVRLATSVRVSEMKHAAAARYAKACQEATEALIDLVALDGVGTDYGLPATAPAAHDFNLPMTQQQHDAACRRDQYHPPAFLYVHNILPRVPDVQRRIAKVVTQ